MINYDFLDHVVIGWIFSIIFLYCYIDENVRDSIEIEVGPFVALFVVISFLCWGFTIVCTARFLGV